MDIETELRRRGCRVTQARRVVWQVLTEAGEHLSAPAITARVHDIDPSVNESSVYRTLTVFADLGLVRESRLDESATWEPFHDDAAIHLLCSTCGTVLHHDTSIVHELRASIERNADFTPAEIDIRVSGSCAACSPS